MATLHCLFGCSIGEVAGMMLGAHYNWSNLFTVVVSVSLAFITGYGLSLRPVVRNGIPLSRAMKLVLAADTLSIVSMEITNNSVMLLIPGAMDAPLFSWFFWGSMALALAVAFAVAYPVNAYLLLKGRGHALTHHVHHGGTGHPHHDDQPNHDEDD